MLGEISHVRQPDSCHVKRWFSCQDMDLFTWSHNKMPVRFQLSFNKRGNEQLFSWDVQHGCHLYRVASGETLAHRYKKTPLLTGTCQQQNMLIIARDFLAASENIDAGIADFIYARLLEYPLSQGWHDASHRDPPAPR